MSKSVLISHKKNYSIVTINRPESHNALSLEVIQSLHSAFQNPKHSIIVLQGAGNKTFCAGADLKYLASANSPQQRQEFFRTLADCIESLASCPAITIARATGNVLAGGMGLLAACDFAYATPNSKFALPEVQKGLAPMVILKVLSRLLTPRVLNDLVLSARSIDSNEALKIGLINQIVAASDLDKVISAKITELAKAPAQTLRFAKEALRVVHELPQHTISPFFADRSALISVVNSSRRR